MKATGIRMPVALESCAGCFTEKSAVGDQHHKIIVTAPKREPALRPDRVSAGERSHEIIQFLRGSEQCGSNIRSSMTKNPSG
jgi:hypothetical protein